MLTAEERAAIIAAYQRALERVRQQRAANDR